MAELKINGRTTVRKLKAEFKEAFGRNYELASKNKQFESIKNTVLTNTQK